LIHQETNKEKKGGGKWKKRSRKKGPGKAEQNGITILLSTPWIYKRVDEKGVKKIRLNITGAGGPLKRDKLWGE